MTNAKKFEEIFDIKPDEYAVDPCEIEGEKRMTDENVKEILTCIIKHIRPDGEFYPFTKDEVEKMKKCLVNKNCLTCKYFDKKKKLMQEYGCLKFMATINDPYKETYSCYEEDTSQ